MSTDEKERIVKPQTHADSNGVEAVLNDEALRNLAGFFDVLIQMDLTQKQRNEQRSKDEKNYLSND